MKLFLNVLALLVVLDAAFSRSVHHESAQLQSAMAELIDGPDVHRDTTQEHLNAAIEGWFDDLTNFAGDVYEGARTGCSYIPLNNKANTQFFGSLVKGYTTLKNACDYINGEMATTEGLFGFTLEDLKNKGKQLLDYAKAGCEKYDSNTDLAKEYIGDNTQYLDIVCHGLSGSNPLVIQSLLDNTIRSVLEDKKVKN